MSKNNSNTTAAHTNAPAAAIAAGAKPSDAARLIYTGAGGAGDDAFGYRKGSGASCGAFVFAMNMAFNSNAPLSRAAVAVDQLSYVEAGIWPGKARGAVEQQIASLHNRSFVETTNGQYRLTEAGMARAKLMLLDLGIAWPEEGETSDAPAKPRKPRKASGGTKTAKKRVKAEVVEEPIVADDVTEGADTSYTLPTDEAPNGQ